jgi:hypothetical protein
MTSGCLDEIVDQARVAGSGCRHPMNESGVGVER